MCCILARSIASYLISPLPPWHPLFTLWDTNSIVYFSVICHSSDQNLNNFLSFTISNKKEIIVGGNEDSQAHHWRILENYPIDLEKF